MTSQLLYMDTAKLRVKNGSGTKKLTYGGLSQDRRVVIDGCNNACLRAAFLHGEVQCAACNWIH